jgi:hypothetical protein
MLATDVLKMARVGVEPWRPHDVLVAEVLAT